MKTIELSRGLEAQVDDDDYEYLSQWKWAADNNNYPVRSERRSETGRKHRKLIRMYRVILNAPDNMQVDHIDVNPLNNQKSNIRLATRSENMRNRKTSKSCKSGFKGVWWNPKRQRWIAYIKYNNRSVVLGRYNNKLQAAHRYNREATKLFGEYARLNDV